MPSSRAASTFSSLSSTNRHSRGSTAAEPLDRQLVDLGLGLAHPDPGRVDDQLEDLVDRQLRAPQLLPLAHVVGEDRHPVAAARAARASASSIGSFGVQRLEVDLPEPVQRRAVAELRLEPPARSSRNSCSVSSPRSSRNSGYSPSRSATRCMPRPSCSIEMPVSSWNAANASIRWFVSTPPKSLITARIAGRPARAHVRRLDLVACPQRRLAVERPAEEAISDAACRRARARSPQTASPASRRGQLVAGPAAARAPAFARQAVRAVDRREAHRPRTAAAPSSSRAASCAATSSSPCAAALAGRTRGDGHAARRPR